MKTEADPLDPDPPATMSKSLGAIRHLERAVLGDEEFEGVVLRYANLYGPGRLRWQGRRSLDQVRKRKVPIIGDGAGVWSFIHLDDAAARRSPRSSTATPASTTSPTTSPRAR